MFRSISLIIASTKINSLKNCDKLHNFISMYRESQHIHFDWVGTDIWAWIPNINTGIDIWYRYFLRITAPRVFGPGYGPAYILGLYEYIIESGCHRSTVLCQLCYNDAQRFTNRQLVIRNYMGVWGGGGVRVINSILLCLM